MNTGKITVALYFIAFVVLMVACDIQQGMMNESGAINITNWNWLQILISVGVGFLLGMFLSKKK